MNDNFSSSEELPLPTQIMKHIYLGSVWNSANLEQLAYLNITHIVNCDIHSRNHFTNSLFTYCNIHLDEMSPNILPEMDVCFQFIDTARKQEKNVLVHCRTGITKSGTSKLSTTSVLIHFSCNLRWVSDGFAPMELGKRLCSR